MFWLGQSKDPRARQFHSAICSRAERRRLSPCTASGSLRMPFRGCFRGAVSAQSAGSARCRQSDGIVQVIYPSRADRLRRRRAIHRSTCLEAVHRCTNRQRRLFDDGALVSAVRACMGRRALWRRSWAARSRDFAHSSDPFRAPRPGTRSIDATAPDAAAWLADIVAQSTAASASEAILPLVIAEGSNPWPLLLSVARDDNRPGHVRRAAIDLAVAWSDRPSRTQRRRGQLGR